MFDIAWTELLVVAVIAIIVVGPKELPGMLRAFGKTFGQIRRTAREFQNTFNDALREAERQANLDELKKDLDGVRAMDPTRDLRKSLDETKRELSAKVDDAAPPKPTLPLAPAQAAATEAPVPAPESTGTPPSDPNATSALPLQPASCGGTEGTGEPEAPAPTAVADVPRAAVGGERR